MVNNNSQLKIIHADPYNLFRDTYKTIIQTSFKSVEINHVDNFADLFNKLYYFSFDILIINNYLIDGNLDEKLERLKVDHSEVKIIMLTLEVNVRNSCLAKEYLEGFVGKDSSPEFLIKAIKEVVKGRRYFQPVKKIKPVRVKEPSQVYFKDILIYKGLICKLCGIKQIYINYHRYYPEGMDVARFCPGYQCQDCGNVQVVYSINNSEYYGPTEEKCEICNGELRRDKLLFCPSCKGNKPQ